MEPSGIYLVHLATSDDPGHCTWFLSICAWLGMWNVFGIDMSKIDMLGFIWTICMRQRNFDCDKYESTSINKS